MAIGSHTILKPVDIAKGVAGMMHDKGILSNLFFRKPMTDFSSEAGDKITLKVPGRLPYREYAWRNDRSQPLVADKYHESKTEVTVGSRIYSHVEVQDEQMEFDLKSWAPLMEQQADAVVRGLEATTVKALTTAPYEVVIGGIERNLRGAVIEARRVLNAFRATNPADRILIIGPDVEAAILKDKDLILAQNVGDDRAGAALGQATIGGLLGFRTVVSDAIPADHAYAVASTAIGQLVGAPAAPKALEHSATVAHKGYAVRWVTGYNHQYLAQMSTVDTYSGANHVKDIVVPATVTESWNPAGKTPLFLRGVKLTIGGTSTYPDKATKKELVDETGITKDKIWTP